MGNARSNSFGRVPSAAACAAGLLRRKCRHVDEHAAAIGGCCLAAVPFGPSLLRGGGMWEGGRGGIHPPYKRPCLGTL